jgi:hypothetical protein
VRLLAQREAIIICSCYRSEVLSLCAAVSAVRCYHFAFAQLFLFSRAGNGPDACRQPYSEQSGEAFRCWTPILNS